MPWDSMIVIMGNSHLKFEHYLILNTPTEVLTASFTPAKMVGKEDAPFRLVPGNVSGAFSS